MHDCMLRRWVNVKAHPRLGPSNRLDHVQAVKSGQQGARILLHMPVVLWNEFQQQPHLFLLDGFDQKAVIIRQEEGAARLAW